MTQNNGKSLNFENMFKEKNAVEFGLEFNQVDAELELRPAPVPLQALQALPGNIKRKERSIDSPGIEEDRVKSVKKVKYSTEHLDLACDWRDCHFSTDSYAEFIRHVRSHIKDTDVRIAEDTSQDMFLCLWDDCGFECYISLEMVRHINYHSFHSKIKSHGLNLIKSQGLKGCVMDSSQRNLFHDLAEPFKCVWGDCIERETDFDHPQEYYWHVASHAEPGVRDCKWGACTKRDFASITRVKEHLRSHTQEKLAGCPTCGCVFANRVKLLDHLKRQQCGNNEFTCTHCNKSFALERLLRDHMRSHINRYECRECGVTWPTPSSLQNHIKYRHSQDRAYSCDICEHKAKSAADLKQHLRIHQGDVLTCMEGCGFSCKSNPVMKNHFMKKHLAGGPAYACHLCDKMYNRGTDLTKHLKNKHEVTSTTSRFRYSRDSSTGFYRAQLIRFEMQENGEEDDPEEMEPVPSLPTSSIRTVSPEMSQQSSPFIPPSSALSTSSSPFLYHPPQISSPYPHPPYVEGYLSAQGSSFGSGRSSPTLASTQASTPGYEYTEMEDLRVDRFTASSPMHRTNLRSEEVDITNELFGTKNQDQNWNRTEDEVEDWTRIEDKLESQEEDQDERARKISDLKEIGAQFTDLNSFLVMAGSLIKK